MMENPHFATHQVMDQQLGNVTVFTFSYPAGWQAASRVHWVEQNSTKPLEISFFTASPTQREWMGMLPIEQCFWLGGFSMFQPGQMHRGAVCVPPMSPDQFLGTCIIPKYRGGCQNLRIVEIRSCPELLRRFQFQQPGAQVDGVRARIEYTDQGTVFEEEFHAVQVMFPPNGGQVNWGMPLIYHFRAPRGGLSAQRANFWRMIHSIQRNPVYDQLRDQKVNMLHQQFLGHIAAWQQKLNAETELSRQISAQNQQWLDQQAARRESDWASHQRAMADWDQQRGAHTQTDAFGDLMMGRETYVDPQQPLGQSQHYGYHEHVWTDGTEYVYSDDANFNPNIGSDRNWSELKKAGIRG